MSNPGGHPPAREALSPTATPLKDAPQRFASSELSSEKRDALQSELARLLARRDQLIASMGVEAYNIDRTTAPHLDSKINSLRERLRDMERSEGQLETPPSSVATPHAELQSSLEGRPGIAQHGTGQPPLDKPASPRTDISRSDIQRIVKEVHSLWRSRQVSSPMDLIGQLIHEIRNGWVSRHIDGVRHRINVLLKLVRQGRFRSSAMLSGEEASPDMSLSRFFWQMLQEGGEGAILRIPGGR